MFKALIIGPVLMSFVACGGAPPPTRAGLQPYSVISEQADSAAGSVVIAIKLNGRPAQSEVKSIAESIIASRRGQYRNVIVNTYIDNASASDAPYVVSRLDGGRVTHQFDPQIGTQKIPTH